MKVTKLPKLDLSVYEETLENGLTIYVIPNSYAKGIYATFTTKYGGGVDEFIPLGEKEYKKFPHGIAHFLEHKMFEQEDGVDPMTFFSERGADANANTTSNRTTYLFSGSKCFPENINYLLDYVQSPYFTDENVEKEKGIITEEAKMYLDHPGRVLFYEVMLQLLLKDANRYPTIGTVKEICSITKEDLYQCYHTFYHPSNMFLVVSGNVDPKEAISLVKENQAKKYFPKMKKIQIKEQKEPDEVGPDKEIPMNVVIPKVSYNLKINIRDLRKEFSESAISYYVGIFLELHFSSISPLHERLLKEGIITNSIGGMAIIVGDYLLVTFDAETKEKEKFLSAIKEELNDLSITEEELAREKKVYISDTLKESDSIYSMNDKIKNQIVKYGYYVKDAIGEIQSLNWKDLNKVKDAFQDYQAGVITIIPKST